MQKLKALLFSLLIMCTTIIYSLPAQASPSDNRIVVNAAASMEVAPDLAYVNCQVKSKGETASLAANATASKLNEVRRSLLALNIVGDDIVNMNYYTSPKHDNKGKVIGYTAETTLKIRVKDLKKTGAVLDKLTAAGVENINGIIYSLSDKNIYRTQLLAKAVENARQQAAVVANAGGRTLGTLIYASFSAVNHQERAVARPMLNKTAKASDSVPTEIEARNLTVSVNVNTSFALL